MIDLGRKNECETAMPSKNNKNKISYPYFSISNVDLGLDEKDVGKTIKAMVSMKINSISKRINTNKEDGTKKTEDYSFDVLGIDLDKKTLDDGKPNSNWPVSKIMAHLKEKK